TMRSVIESENASRFYHGVYDARIEANCWWIKTLDLGNDNLIDTLIYQHAPTGLWGTMPDFEVSAACTVFDPMTKDTFTLIGTESGNLCIAFDEDVFTNYLNPSGPFAGTADSVGFVASSINITATALQVDTLTENVPGTIDLYIPDARFAFTAGDYFDMFYTHTGTLFRLRLIVDSIPAGSTIRTTTSADLSPSDVYFVYPPLADSWVYIENSTTGEAGAWVHLTDIDATATLIAGEINGFLYDKILIDGQTTAGTTMPSGIGSSCAI